MDFPYLSFLTFLSVGRSRFDPGDSEGEGECHSVDSIADDSSALDCGDQSVYQLRSPDLGHAVC